MEYQIYNWDTEQSVYYENDETNKEEFEDRLYNICKSHVKKYEKELLDELKLKPTDCSTDELTDWYYDQKLEELNSEAYCNVDEYSFSIEYSDEEIEY